MAVEYQSWADTATPDTELKVRRDSCSSTQGSQSLLDVYCA